MPRAARERGKGRFRREALSSKTFDSSLGSSFEAHTQKKKGPRAVSVILDLLSSRVGVQGIRGKGKEMSNTENLISRPDEITITNHANSVENDAIIKRVRFSFKLFYLCSLTMRRPQLSVFFSPPFSSPFVCVGYEAGKREQQG
jgi:hypothetical protein